MKKQLLTNLHVAEKTMKLKDINYCLSFISLLWRGEVIMCIFNNIQKEISNIYCTQALEVGDVEQLENLIMGFISDKV
jgi:hypothetical protein